jgi:hypothetical protein
MILIDSNRELHRRLVYEKVAHDYTEPGHIPGNIGKMPCLITFYFFSKVLKVIMT